MDRRFTKCTGHGESQGKEDIQRSYRHARQDYDPRGEEMLELGLSSAGEATVRVRTNSYADPFVDLHTPSNTGR